MFVWRKKHVVTSMVEQYLAKADACLNAWRQALELYLSEGLGGAFDELVAKTHIAESASNDIRREVEWSLYEKGLIPESRGDIASLLEVLDEIPTQADRTVHTVQIELLAVPRRFSDKLTELVHLNHDCFVDLTQAVRFLFEDLGRVQPFVRDIDKKESAIDHVEREIIRAVFSDPETAPDQRILLKDLVMQIARISDLCEDAADRVTILTVKRMV